jgi:hypothetical protein
LAFGKYSLFWNVPYKIAHMTEGTALSRSWKKTPTAFRVSVSKPIPVCGTAENWGLLRFLVHTQKHTHTHTVWFLRKSDKLVAEAAKYTTTKKERKPMKLAVFVPDVFWQFRPHCHLFRNSHIGNSPCICVDTLSLIQCRYVEINRH